MEDNVAYNRHYWDTYVDRHDDSSYERDRAAPGAAVDLTVVGEEWGTPEAVDEIVRDFILAEVTPKAVAVEIGSGGGRIARRVAPHVGELWCVDVSARMLDRLRQTLADHHHVRYVHTDDATLPPQLREAVDFVYSFDVFVHLDLHTQWKYIDAISRALRPGGRAFLHTANLASAGGWSRFAAQPHYTVAGYYYVIPELVRLLVDRAGLRVVREGAARAGNSYLEHDYLVVVEKPVSSE